MTQTDQHGGPDDRDTGELTQPVAETTNRPVNFPSATKQVDLAARTHTGKVRAHNEDHFLVVRITRALETLLTNLAEPALQSSFTELAYGMAVADGMGGMAAGEVASSMALRKLVELAVNTSDWVMKINERQDGVTIMQRMTDRFRKVDEFLGFQAEKEPVLLGMGTTLTVAVSLGPEVIVGHIGDSRAYLLRNHKLYQLTRDHTLAQDLLDAGISGPSDAATRAMRHVLTAALGSNADDMDAQVQRFHLNDGDQMLLCTDGLNGVVADAEIASTLRTAESADDACGALVDQALSAGGPDNITVVVARYRFPAQP